MNFKGTGSFPYEYFTFLGDVIRMPNGLRDFSLRERVFIVSKMYNAIAEHFAHWEDAGFTPEELDRVYGSFLERAMETNGRREFTLLMMELAGTLHNGHSGYADSELYRRLAPLGFALESADGQWIVRSSDVNGLVPGDSIEAIQGISVDEWYEKTRNYITSKKESSRKVKFQTILPYMIESGSLQVDYLDRNDERRSGVFERPAAFEQHQWATEGRWLEPNIGYIRIPSFGKPDFEQRALDYVREFGQAEALIVDVRGNSGGNTPGKLIAALMNRPWRWWTERSCRPYPMYKRHQDGLLLFAHDYTYTEWKGGEISPVQDAYQGQLYLLTDRYTGSSAEDFAMPFHTTGRALIVGDRTWGSTGQPYLYEFGNGALLYVGSIRAYFPDGSAFEGIGISPDIELRPTRADYYAERDPVLNKALELALG